MSGYVINEEAIGVAFRYLKIHRPEKANRASAIQLLEIMHGAAKKLASTDPEFAEELANALEELEREQLHDSKEQGEETAD